MTAAPSSPLKQALPYKEIEISPNYFTLSSDHPLYQELSQQTLWYTPPRITRSVPRFYDISCITENAKRFKSVVDVFVQRYKAMGKDGPTHVLGFDARGFILGAPIAMELGLPFVLLRKVVKMPASLMSEGADDQSRPETLTVRHTSIPATARVILVDDFIATGGTIVSGIDLIETIGATVVEVVAITTMPHLHGVSRIHNADDGAYAKVRVFTIFDDCNQGMYARKSEKAVAHKSNL